MAIKAELFQWYKEQRKDPEWLAKGTEDARLIWQQVVASSFQLFSIKSSTVGLLFEGSSLQTRFGT